MIQQKIITLADAVTFGERMNDFGLFEFVNGQIIPVNETQAVEESLIEYVLSPDFDEKQITTRFLIPTKKHDTIVSNLHIEIGNIAKKSGYKVYLQATHVFILATESYRDPDIVLVSKADEQHNELQQVLNPLLLIEVLSPFTQVKDKSEKLEEYQSVESLQQYVIVWQDKVKAVVYLRIDENKWEQEILSDPSQFIKFKTLDYKITLADLYEDVDFSQDK